MLRPPSLSSILAANTVRPAPAPAPTLSVNQARLAANRAAVAERRANAAAPAPAPAPAPSPTLAANQARFAANQAAAAERSANATNTSGQRINSSGVALTNHTDAGSYGGQQVNSRYEGSPTPRTIVGDYVSSFKDTLNNATSKDDYRAGINYDTLSPQAKRISDIQYNAENKKRGRQGITAIPEKKVPDIFEDRKTDLINEEKKQQTILDEDKTRYEQRESDIKDEDTSNFAAQEADLSAERDKFIGEQTGLQSQYEGTRLNQVRGNIIQSLIQRGVDISRIAPEQMIALAGEQGSKALNDIFEAKEKTTRNVESARSAALGQLNVLRDRRAITNKQYTAAIVDINSKTAAAKQQARNNMNSQVFAIAQTGDQQKRTDKTQAVNTILAMGSQLGLTGAQTGLLAQFATMPGYGPDQAIALMNAAAKSGSAIGKVLASNASDAQKLAAFKNAIDQKKLQIDVYDSETKRIVANRPPSRSNNNFFTSQADAFRAAQNN